MTKPKDLLNDDGKAELAPMTHPLAPLELIRVAIERGVSPEQLEKLMDLQERYERNRAAEAFAEAMAKFQRECPSVMRTQAIPDKQGNTKYKYAPYEKIKEACGPLQAECGIVTSIDIKPLEGGMLHGTIYLRVGSHVETRSMVMPIPQIPNANASQMYVGAGSYLKRALYVNALDIPIAGEDQDGQGLIEPLNDEQVMQINDLFDECRRAGRAVDFKRFMTWLNVESLNEVRQQDFPKIIAELKRKAASK